ncbi:hypothetical protein [Marinobacterium stanieri]|uniref:Uncharacterized protein n=1 Tax=Marinobacterium stanieri TaxID=49186 RepID=A0A1N6XK39_9GAMM|nr:hypothetical protein [Marinobacterium stanieri]SIR02589.1 hypothetical protein SAMN05421647_11465 [Marinobacterium stanieri]
MRSNIDHDDITYCIDQGFTEKQGSQMFVLFDIDALNENRISIATLPSNVRTALRVATQSAFTSYESDDEPSECVEIQVHCTNSATAMAETKMPFLINTVQPKADEYSFSVKRSKDGLSIRRRYVSSTPRSPITDKAHE